MAVVWLWYGCGMDVVWLWYGCGMDVVWLWYGLWYGCGMAVCTKEHLELGVEASLKHSLFNPASSGSRRGADSAMCETFHGHWL
ncbi:hypothetical protein BgiMline_013142 [Biomphalaria glabrata]